jgi:hypothetical protein
LLLLTAAAGCTTTPIQPPPEPLFITIDATPPDAYVYLDGRPLGEVREVSSRVLFVTSGPHTVVIVAPGMRPFRRDLVVQDGSPQLVRAILRPQ